VEEALKGGQGSKRVVVLMMMIMIVIHKIILLKFYKKDFSSVFSFYQHMLHYGSASVKIPSGTQ
jgi:hypothetical protein